MSDNTALPSAASAADDSSRRGIDIASSLDALRRIVRALRLAATGVEKTTGLSPAQLYVLQRVTERPGQSLSELAESTLTDRTSVAAVVDRLVGRGLVERTRSTVDRRRVDVVATAEGAALLGVAPHAPTVTLLDAMQTLADEELRCLSDGLHLLEQALGIDKEPAGMLFDDDGSAKDA